MATMTVATESRRGMASEMVINRMESVKVPILNAARRIAEVLDTQSFTAVLLSGILTFLSFLCGAVTLGSVAGIAFMLALRPFTDRAIGEPRGVRD